MRYLIPVFVLGLAACTQATPTVPPTVTTVTPASVCQAVANAKSLPAVQSAIAGLDPKSAAGIIWTYAASGCNGPYPIAGVNATWLQQVWAMFLQIAPAVIPAVVGLL